MNFNRPVVKEYPHKGAGRKIKDEMLDDTDTGSVTSQGSLLEEDSQHSSVGGAQAARPDEAPLNKEGKHSGREHERGNQRLMEEEQEDEANRPKGSGKTTANKSVQKATPPVYTLLASSSVVSVEGGNGEHQLMKKLKTQEDGTVDVLGLEAEHHIIRKKWEGTLPPKIRRIHGKPRLIVGICLQLCLLACFIALIYTQLTHCTTTKFLSATMQDGGGTTCNTVPIKNTMQLEIDETNEWSNDGSFSRRNALKVMSFNAYEKNDAAYEADIAVMNQCIRKTNEFTATHTGIENLMYLDSHRCSADKAGGLVLTTPIKWTYILDPSDHDVYYNDDIRHNVDIIHTTKYGFTSTVYDGEFSPVDFYTSTSKNNDWSDMPNDNSECPANNIAIVEGDTVQLSLDCSDECVYGSYLRTGARAICYAQSYTQSGILPVGGPHAELTFSLADVMKCAAYNQGITTLDDPDLERFVLPDISSITSSSSSSNNNAGDPAIVTSGGDASLPVATSSSHASSPPVSGSSDPTSPSAASGSGSRGSTSSSSLNNYPLANPDYSSGTLVTAAQPAAIVDTSSVPASTGTPTSPTSTSIHNSSGGGGGGNRDLPSTSTTEIPASSSSASSTYSSMYLHNMYIQGDGSRSGWLHIDKDTQQCSLLSSSPKVLITPSISYIDGNCNGGCGHRPRDCNDFALRVTFSLFVNTAKWPIKGGDVKIDYYGDTFKGYVNENYYQGVPEGTRPMNNQFSCKPLLTEIQANSSVPIALQQGYYDCEQTACTDFVTAVGAAFGNISALEGILIALLLIFFSRCLKQCLYDVCRIREEEGEVVVQLPDEDDVERALLELASAHITQKRRQGKHLSGLYLDKKEYLVVEMNPTKAP